MEKRLEDILLNVSLSNQLDSGNLREAETLLLNSALQGLQITRVGIWLWVNNNDGISCQYLIDRTHNTEIEELVLHRKDFPIYFNALDKERTIAAGDAHSHPDTKEFSTSYLGPLGINSMLDIPIRHLGRMVGVICCEQIGPKRDWSADECSFTAALADLYGRAMTAAEKLVYQSELEALNKNLEETIRERTRDLQDKVTILIETQNKLIESEKMASLGSLVAGIAHEVNTPLGISITACSNCSAIIKKTKQSFEDNTLSKSRLTQFFNELTESNNITERNLYRAADLISNFKKTAADQTNFDLMDIKVTDYLDIILSSLKPHTKKLGIVFHVDCDPQLSIRTLPGAIAQIITNLVMNACHHAFKSSENNRIHIEVTEHQKDSIKFVFADNGCGMSAFDTKKAIEPFFTTKRGQGGTGLGLSISYNLVLQSLKGQFSLASTLNQGTQVEFIIPKILQLTQRTLNELNGN